MELNMVTAGAKVRIAFVLVLVLSITCLLTPGPLAASGQQSEKPAQVSGQVFAGLLAGSGSITINGQSVTSGTSVLSGSVIETGSDGRAAVTLGAPGRIEILPDTRVTLVFTDAMFHVKTDCDTTHVLVRRGQLDVRTPEPGILKAGEIVEEGKPPSVKAQYKAPFQATAASADIALSCKGDPVAALPARKISRGLLALLLAGATAGTITGVIISTDNQPDNPDVSPIRP